MNAEEWWDYDEEYADDDHEEADSMRILTFRR